MNSFELPSNVAADLETIQTEWQSELLWPMNTGHSACIVLRSAATLEGSL